MPRGDASTAYATIPTDVDGIELRILKEFEEKVKDAPEDLIAGFVKTAKQHAKLDKKIEELSERRSNTRLKLIKYANAVPGLRGVRSQPDAFDLLAVLRELTSYDRDFLRPSLGIRYSNIVSEEYVARMAVPESLVSEESFREALQELLVRFRVPKQDLPKALQIDVELRVDEEKLEELERKGAVKLLTGARSIEEQWAVRVEPTMVPVKLRKKKPQPQKPKKG